MMGAERSAQTKAVAPRVGRVRLVMRPAWADRFRTPTPQQLIAGVPASVRALAVAAREQLRKHPQASETLAWLGTWQWTMQFRTPSSNGVSWAYLILNPQRPQVCIPVHATTLAQLPAKDMPRSLREAIALAPAVDGVRWATWDLQSKSQVQTLVRFASACDAASVAH